MTQRLRHLLPPLLAVVLLGGCAGFVHLTAPSAPSETASGTSDVPPSAFPITGATDSPIDQFARNALTDLNMFWKKAYPTYFGGRPFRPLAGGYFSVDSQGNQRGVFPPTGIGCRALYIAPHTVAGNAAYFPQCDSIAYDRSLLEELSKDYGRFLVAVVMAHEFGHALQGRFGLASSGRSIQDETQADCFAGAWARWVDEGKAEHVALKTRELDDVLRGFLLLRDQVGSDPQGRQAHGSYFDRVSAFYEGFEDGVPSCRDDFGPNRLFTAASFTNDLDYANQGNAPYGDIVTWIKQTLPLFWSPTFQRAFGRPFRAPRITAVDGPVPPCGSSGGERELAYCPSDSTVSFDQPDLIGPAYDKIGDFAVAAGLSIPYALAARAEGHRSVDDAAAVRSAVCLTGWYTHDWYSGAFSKSLKVTLSPGDVDEAVEFLLVYGADKRVLPDVTTSGFQLVGAFRAGFLTGGPACDIGL
jgi:predicted metalloprotease